MGDDFWFLRFPWFHIRSSVHSFVTFSCHRIKSIQNQTQGFVVFDPIKHLFNFDSSNFHISDSHENSTKWNERMILDLNPDMYQNCWRNGGNYFQCPIKVSLSTLTLRITLIIHYWHDLCHNDLWRRSMSNTPSPEGEEPMSDEWRSYHTRITRTPNTRLSAIKAITIVNHNVHCYGVECHIFRFYSIIPRYHH